MTVTARDRGTPVKSTTIQVTIDVDRNLFTPEFINLPFKTSVNEDLQVGLNVFDVKAEDKDTEVCHVFVFAFL